MSSLTRMLSVLDLFSKDHTAITADKIAEALGLTRTTCYRYIGELLHAGLLVSNGGVYTLGPRIIQFDYRIRESDPLLNAATDVVADLVRKTSSTGLLATIYNDRIINIHQDSHGGNGGHGSNGGKPVPTYGRGREVPTFRSASSKVILAHLKTARLKRLWSAHQQEPDVSALGEDWDSFWSHMQAIKAKGYWISHGELDPEIDGIAVPILFPEGDVAGSMTLVFPRQHFRLYNEQALGEMMLEAAARVREKLPAAA